MPLQIFAAFLATIAFAVLFQAPRSEYVQCGLAGAVSWACYTLCLHISASVTLSTLGATIALTLLCRLLAVARQMPSTVFLVCGIFPLVPGAGIYYTAYHFIMGENQLAVSRGIETVKIAVSIALGIVLVLSLPGGWFSIGRFLRRTEPRA